MSHIGWWMCVGIFAWCAFWDIYKRFIPHTGVLGLLGVAVYEGVTWHGWILGCVSLFVLILLTFVCEGICKDKSGASDNASFGAGVVSGCVPMVMGAGDIKMIAACVVLLPLPMLGLFFLSIGLGGLCTSVCLRQREIPLAPAIAISFLVCRSSGAEYAQRYIYKNLLL